MQDSENNSASDAESLTAPRLNPPENNAATEGTSLLLARDDLGSNGSDNINGQNNLNNNNNNSIIANFNPSGPKDDPYRTTHLIFSIFEGIAHTSAYVGLVYLFKVISYPRPIGHEFPYPYFLAASDSFFNSFFALMSVLLLVFVIKKPDLFDSEGQSIQSQAQPDNQTQNNAGVNDTNEEDQMNHNENEYGSENQTNLNQTPRRSNSQSNLNLPGGQNVAQNLTGSEQSSLGSWGPFLINAGINALGGIFWVTSLYCLPASTNETIQMSGPAITIILSSLLQRNMEYNLASWISVIPIVAGGIAAGWEDTRTHREDLIRKIDQKNPQNQYRTPTVLDNLPHAVALTFAWLAALFRCLRIQVADLLMGTYELQLTKEQLQEQGRHEEAAQLVQSMALGQTQQSQSTNLGGASTHLNNSESKNTVLSTSTVMIDGTGGSSSPDDRSRRNLQQQDRNGLNGSQTNVDNTQSPKNWVSDRSALTLVLQVSPLSCILYLIASFMFETQKSPVAQSIERNEGVSYKDSDQYFFPPLQKLFDGSVDKADLDYSTTRFLILLKGFCAFLWTVTEFLLVQRCGSYCCSVMANVNRGTAVLIMINLFEPRGSWTTLKTIGLILISTGVGIKLIFGRAYNKQLQLEFEKAVEEEVALALSMEKAQLEERIYGRERVKLRTAHDTYGALGVLEPLKEQDVALSVKSSKSRGELISQDQQDMINLDHSETGPLLVSQWTGSINVNSGRDIELDNTFFTSPVSAQEGGSPITTIPDQELTKRSRGHIALTVDDTSHIPQRLSQGQSQSASVKQIPTILEETSPGSQGSGGYSDEEAQLQNQAQQAIMNRQSSISIDDEITLRRLASMDRNDSLTSQGSVRIKKKSSRSGTTGTMTNILDHGPGAAVAHTSPLTSTMGSINVNTLSPKSSKTKSENQSNNLSTSELPFLDSLFLARESSGNEASAAIFNQASTSDRKGAMKSQLDQLRHLVKEEAKGRVLEVIRQRSNRIGDLSGSEREGAMASTMNLRRTESERPPNTVNSSSSNSNINTGSGSSSSRYNDPNNVQGGAAALNTSVEYSNNSGGGPGPDNNNSGPGGLQKSVTQ